MIGSDVRRRYVASVAARIGWHGLSTDDYRETGDFLVPGTAFSSGAVIWEECQRVDHSVWARDPQIQLAPEDVLVTKDGSIGKVAFVEALPGRATLNSGVFRIRGSPRTQGRFLFWVFQSRLMSDFIELLRQGSTINHLYQKDVLDFRVPLTSVAGQLAIADYLDARTARIDALIERNRRLVSLLADRRTSALSAAFYGEGSISTKLKHLLAQPPCYGVLVPRFSDTGVPFIRVNDLLAVAKGDRPRLTIEPHQSLEYQRTVVRAGDVLVSVVGSVDKVAVVPASLAGANVARAICRLVPRPGISSELLGLWLQTPEYLHQAAASTSGDTAQPTLNMADLANFDVRFPALEAMERFSSALIAHLRTVDEARQVIGRQIDLLVQRRQALITAAVTGELEIPEVAA